MSAQREISFLSLILAFIIFFCGASVAQNYHDKVAPSIVTVKVNGTLSSDNTTIEERTSGFSVSRDGYVLTTYGAIQRLGKVIPETITYKVSIDGTDYSAVRASAAPEMNLLLLKIIGHGKKSYKRAAFSKRWIDSGEELFSGGSKNPLKGATQKRHEKRPHLTQTDLKFESTHEGGPVYDRNGVVVGIARGELPDKDGNPRNYFIPIEYAFPILAPVLMREIEHSIIWKADVWDDKGSEEPLGRIHFTKVLPTGPYPVKIEVDSTRFGYKKNKRNKHHLSSVKKKYDFQFDGDNRHKGIVHLGKEFSLLDDQKDLHDFRRIFLSMKVIATMSDGSTLPAVNLLIER